MHEPSEPGGVGVPPRPEWLQVCSLIVESTALRGHPSPHVLLRRMPLDPHESYGVRSLGPNEVAEPLPQIPVPAKGPGSGMQVDKATADA
eukprot:9922138-Alexandrium_andersonii.AAC.1